MKADELSCKDLMIGDWVMINPISYYQVEQIRMEFGELRIYLKGTEVFATENEIMPVPLTEAILEKNGFKNGKLNVSPQYYLEDNDVFIGVTLKDLPDKHKGIDIAKGRLFFQLDVSHIEEILYVHTLQHALRLCGIKKEIVL